MRKTLYILIGVVVLVSLLLGACAKTTPSTTPATTKPVTTTPGTTTPATTKPATTTPSTTTPAPTGDKYGGIWKEALTVGPSRPIGYPPEAAPDSYTTSSPALERLVGVNVDGSIQAELATTWKVADDGKSITLGLRKGVKFHDGSDFNADVAKWNLDMEIAAKVSGASTWKSIDKVDDYTIRINLSNYQNTVLSNLSSGVTQMISKANFDKVGIEGCRFNPVGTGPFLFVEYQRDAKLTYKRNPNYWDTGKPYIDGITMTVIADSTVRKLAFQKGDVTILRVAGGLDAVELQKAGFLMKTAPGGTFVLVPDSNNPKSPWSNVNVRLAASYALDRDALAKALGFGYLNVAYQLFPGYPDTKIPNLAETKFNVAKAKDLLTQAGYPNGFKTTIHSFSRIVPNDYINAVAGQFRNIGIDVTTDFPEAGKYDDLRFNGWDGMLGHGLANFSNHNQEFTFYFASTVFPTLKRPAGWQQGVDASLGSKEVDPKLVQAVIQIMYDDMTVIPYLEQIQIAFYQKGVNDPYADFRGLQWPVFKEVWLDKIAR